MLIQVYINGFVAGCAATLVAVSFGIISSTARFFHFAHGATYMIGAYLAYALGERVGLGPLVGVVAGIGGAAVLGAAMELVVYRPLRRANSSALILFISSLGLLIVLQNVVSLVIGDETRMLATSAAMKGFRVLGARVSAVQAAIIAACLVVTPCVWAVIRHTQIGRWIRAMANDPELAMTVGVPADRTILVTFLLGSALAGFTGILVGYDTDLTPAMGFNTLLIGVVASMIGGIGSIPGALLGGLLVGLTQHLAAWWLPTEWQSAVIFLMLVVVLLFRPQGFFGKPLKRVSI